MFRLLLISAIIMVVAAHDCSSPCPSYFMACHVCGQQISNAANYHTFSSPCDLECHAKVNPTRAFKAFGKERQSCSNLNKSEKTLAISKTNEFQWPYHA